MGSDAASCSGASSAGASKSTSYCTHNRTIRRPRARVSGLEPGKAGMPRCRVVAVHRKLRCASEQGHTKLVKHVFQLTHLVDVETAPGGCLALALAATAAGCGLHPRRENRWQDRWAGIGSRGDERGESGWGESQRQEVANRTPAPAPGLWRQSHWIAAMGQYAYQKRAGGRPVKRAMTPGPAPHQDPATDLAKSTADRLQRPGGTGITCECVRDVCTTATRSTVRARYQVEGKGKRKGPRSPRFS